MKIFPLMVIEMVFGESFQITFVVCSPEDGNEAPPRHRWNHTLFNGIACCGKAMPCLWLKVQCSFLQQIKKELK